MKYLIALLLSLLSAHASLTVLGKASDISWTTVGGIRVASFGGGGGGGGATYVFSDDFNRTGELIGSAPQIGTNWDGGTPGVKACSNGVVVISTACDSQTFAGVTIGSGHIYTLTATVTISNASGAMFIGFDNSSGAYVASVKGPLLYIDNGGGLYYTFNGWSSFTSLPGTANPYGTPNDLKIVLNTTTSPWTCQFWVNGTQKGSDVSLDSGWTTTQVSIGSYEGASSTIGPLKVEIQ